MDQPKDEISDNGADRRKWPRLRIDQPSTLRFIEGSISGTLVDLSGGGALVQLPSEGVGFEVRKGDILQLDIPDQGTEPAAVERVEGVRIGVSFFCPK